MLGGGGGEGRGGGRASGALVGGVCCVREGLRKDMKGLGRSVSALLIFFPRVFVEIAVPALTVDWTQAVSLAVGAAGAPNSAASFVTPLWILGEAEKVDRFLQGFLLEGDRRSVKIKSVICY